MCCVLCSLLVEDWTDRPECDQYRPAVGGSADTVHSAAQTTVHSWGDSGTESELALSQTSEEEEEGRDRVGRCYRSTAAGLCNVVTAVLCSEDSSGASCDCCCPGWPATEDCSPVWPAHQPARPVPAAASPVLAALLAGSGVNLAGEVSTLPWRCINSIVLSVQVTRADLRLLEVLATRLAEERAGRRGSNKWDENSGQHSCFGFGT